MSSVSREESVSDAEEVGDSDIESMNNDTQNDASSAKDDSIQPTNKYSETYSQLLELEEENSYTNRFMTMMKTKKFTESNHTLPKNDIGFEGSCFEQSLEAGNRWFAEHGEFKGNITETQSTENFVRQMNGFYEEMAAKLKLMKNSSILKRSENVSELLEANYLAEQADDLQSIEEITFSEGDGDTVAKAKRIFSSVDKTRKYTRYYETINKLDNEIEDRKSILSEAKSERMATQEEMCSTIYNSTRYRDKHTQLFLDLCCFERLTGMQDNQRNNSSHPGNATGDAGDTGCTAEHPSQRNIKDGMSGKDFIRRNIELAKQGMMATCSLTDEEKQKLEDILSDLDDLIPEDSENNTVTTTTMNEEPSDDEDVEEEEQDDEERMPDGNSSNNAFRTIGDHKSRLDYINSRLREFSKEKKEDTEEKKSEIESSTSDWKQFLLENSLKDVNHKLKEIQDAYTKLEEERLKVVTIGKTSSDCIVDKRQLDDGNKAIEEANTEHTDQVGVAASNSSD